MSDLARRLEQVAYEWQRTTDLVGQLTEQLSVQLGRTCEVTVALIEAVAATLTEQGGGHE